MSTQYLTDDFVRALTPPAKYNQLHWDADVAGLSSLAKQAATERRNQMKSKVMNISDRRQHNASKKIIRDEDLLFAVTKRPGEQFGIGFRTREDVGPLEYLEGVAAIIELVASAWGRSVEETLETIKKNMIAYPMRVDEVAEMSSDGSLTTLSRN